MSTTNPIIINGTELLLPSDRAVSITTSSGLRIELAAQQQEPVKVVETQVKKKRKAHEVRPRHLVHEDRLRLARAIARAGDKGITLIELRDRLGLSPSSRNTAYNDLIALKSAGLIATRPGRIPQLLRYFATARATQ